MDRREMELSEPENVPAPHELAYSILWIGGLLLIACMIAGS